jgi:alanyl-tRNA synthetase|tara:strand:- start:15192 stop:16382 length:1191 start_codon:yes stop_codon:yes gene_type:complete
MKHHHDLYEKNKAIFDMKKYWLNPQITTFSSEIKEINGRLIRLNENYFYPEGGGQPPDHGVISTETTQSSVIDVQEIDNEVWLKLNKNEFQPNEIISAKIDKSRRINLSRNHTSQHLISAIFMEDFEYDTVKATIDLKSSEIEFDKKLNWDILEKGINKVNSHILQSHPINSKFFDKENISDLKLRGNISDLHSIYRIVEIKDVDLNPCGGTHVENTSEIQIVAVRKLENNKLKFISGHDAEAYLTKQTKLIYKISNLIKTSPKSIFQELERIYTNNIDMKKELLKNKHDILNLQLRNTVSKNIHNFTLIYSFVNQIERSIILSYYGEINFDKIILIEDQNSTFFVLTGSQNLTSDLSKYLKNIGLKGGGQGNFIMGNNPTKFKLIDLIETYLSSS